MTRTSPHSCRFSIGWAARCICRTRHFPRLWRRFRSPAGDPLRQLIDPFRPQPADGTPKATEGRRTPPSNSWPLKLSHALPFIRQRPYYCKFCDFCRTGRLCLSLRSLTRYSRQRHPLHSEVIHAVSRSSFLSSLLQVIMIDLVLAGDNAVVIGLAAAGLASDVRRKAILIGIIAATILRIFFALITTQLLALGGGLLIAGGVLCFMSAEDVS